MSLTGDSGSKKLVFPTATDMIDQDNLLKPLIQFKYCPQTGIEVEKNMKIFWENIRPWQCQPYRGAYLRKELLSEQMSVSHTLCMIG